MKTKAQLKLLVNCSEPLKGLNVNQKLNIHEIASCFGYKLRNEIKWSEIFNVVKIWPAEIADVNYIQIKKGRKSCVIDSRLPFEFVNIKKEKNIKQVIGNEIYINGVFQGFTK